jgi:hypothetical protein
MSKRLASLLAAVVLAAARPAIGQPPEPAGEPAFSFPGAVENPPSAAAAGTALAGLWLADEPFSNPAAPARLAISLSPQLLRMSRQDLRAGNRDFDESPAFFEGAGGAIGAPFGNIGLWLYAHQPVLRREDNAYSRGTGTDPTVEPAVLRNTSTVRETRAGLAVSVPAGPLRAGAAVEWSRRDDSYESIERSGSPNSGTRRLTFSGSAVGLQAGARMEWGDRWIAGAAVRLLPEMDLEGEQSFDLLSGDSVGIIRARRESGWEAGVSVRFRQSPAFSLIAGAGATSGPAWESLGVDPAVSGAWRAALEYHDPAEPWSVRFGLGLEKQEGVPEDRATVVGIGFGYDLDGILIDLGATRRGLHRDDAPTFYDDRVVVTLTIGL